MEFFPELFNPFGEPEPEATVPANVNLATTGVDPNLIRPQFNTANIGGANKANLVQTGSVMQNALTQSEMAFLSDEEKAMRIKQRVG